MMPRKTWECGCISYHCPKKGIRMVERCLNHEFRSPASSYDELNAVVKKILDETMKQMMTEMFSNDPLLAYLKGK